METKKETSPLLDYLADLFKPHTKLYPSDAIWLTKAVLTSKGRNIRITPGMEICIKDGQLIDCIDKPTHVITSMMGTLSDTGLQFSAMDLKSQELITIKLN